MLLQNRRRKWRRPHRFIVLTMLLACLVAVTYGIGQNGEGKGGDNGGGSCGKDDDDDEEDKGGGGDGGDGGPGGGDSCVRIPSTNIYSIAFDSSLYN